MSKRDTGVKALPTFSFQMPAAVFHMNLRLRRQNVLCDVQRHAVDGINGCRPWMAEETKSSYSKDGVEDVDGIARPISDSTTVHVLTAQDELAQGRRIDPVESVDDC